MFSLPCLKDDGVAVQSSAVLKEQGKTEPTQPNQDKSDKTQKEQGTIESKIEETTKNSESHKEGSQSEENSTEDFEVPTTSGSTNEEDRNVPSSSNFTNEEVDSRRPDSLPGGSGNTKPATRRILLKRRSSRISTPTIGVVNTVAEEVDSAAPRASKRRTQKKKMVALFLESDYPRKK